MTEQSDQSVQSEQPLDRTKTKLSKRWLRKFIVFLVLCVGFGIYGYYDATIAYPNRGEQDADYKLYEYLYAADAAHGLALPLGIPEGETPQSVLMELNARQQELASKAGSESRDGRDASAELAKLAWLDSLSKIWKLTPERVRADLEGSPRDLLRELRAEWENRDKPKPLSWFDIPVQWLFVVVGFGLGLWLAVHMFRVARRTYTWDRAELRLGLPGGTSIVPADVAEFDKRKWDKFLFYFKIKPEHPDLGGRELKLDLYQYEPLEDWAIAMHKHARPEDYEDEEAEQDESAGTPAEAGAESEPGEAEQGERAPE